jgi:hypothetical protein
MIDSRLNSNFGRGVGGFQFGMTPFEVNNKLNKPFLLKEDLSNMASDVGFQNMRYLYKELVDKCGIIPFGFTDECLRKAGYVVFLFHEHRLLNRHPPDAGLVEGEIAAF